MNGGHVTLLVEKDYKTACICAANHNTEVYSVEKAYACIREKCSPKCMVLHADMADINVYILAGLLGINMWLASPPCQPWSRASWQRGLDDEDGAIFAKFVMWAGISRVICLNLENVPGLPEHPHFGTLRKLIDHAGFDVVLSTRDKAMPILPIMRTRWLATCIRKDIHFLQPNCPWPSRSQSQSLSQGSVRRIPLELSVVFNPICRNGKCHNVYLLQLFLMSYQSLSIYLSTCARVSI